jgi:hypothetical protein
MTVATTPHGDLQGMSAGEFYGVLDVIGAGASYNQLGSSLRVGIPIVDASRCLVTGIRGENETTL